MQDSGSAAEGELLSDATKDLTRYLSADDVRGFVVSVGVAVVVFFGTSRWAGVFCIALFSLMAIIDTAVNGKRWQWAIVLPCVVAVAFAMAFLI
ncbi:MAG TPA: hypothetical protein VK963_03170 [Candidatus Saccharimonadales bacterium]|nr:hypothetical protein [Candidatus Saccharimonadales bacterium]